MLQIYDEIFKDLLQLTEDVVFNRNPDATEKLIEFAETVKQDAVSEKKQDEWVTNTAWHNVTYWKNKKDEIIDFLKKGEMIAISGKLNTRKYTDKQGQDRYITEIIAQKLEQVIIA